MDGRVSDDKVQVDSGSLFRTSVQVSGRSAVQLIVQRVVVTVQETNGAGLEDRLNAGRATQ